MQPRVFHLVVPSTWRESPSTAEWRPGSLDQQGFVHLSFGEQLRGTLDIHFAEHDEVWLLEVDGRSIAADLRLERSRNDERFPHLYRALRRDEIQGWWQVRRDGAHWQVPEFGATADDDRPARHPGAPR